MFSSGSVSFGGLKKWRKVHVFELFKYPKNRIQGKIKKPKKSQKKFKKSIDKGGEVCYTSGALLRKRQCKRSLKIEQQRFMID